LIRPAVSGQKPRACDRASPIRHLKIYFPLKLKFAEHTYLIAYDGIAIIGMIPDASYRVFQDLLGSCSFDSEKDTKGVMGVVL
jgi:hypothetical protein